MSKKKVADLPDFDPAINMTLMFPLRCVKAVERSRNRRCLRLRSGSSFSGSTLKIELHRRKLPLQEENPSLQREKPFPKRQK